MAMPKGILRLLTLLKIIKIYQNYLPSIPPERALVLHFNILFLNFVPLKLPNLKTPAVNKI